MASIAGQCQTSSGSAPVMGSLNTTILSTTSLKPASMIRKSKTRRFSTTSSICSTGPALVTFLQTYRINAINLSYVLYELEEIKRRQVLDILIRELPQPGIIIVTEPQDELHREGCVVEVLIKGDREPAKRRALFQTATSWGMSSHSTTTKTSSVRLAWSSRTRPKEQRPMPESRQRHDQPSPTRLNIPHWLGLVAGLTGTILGIIASLYSSGFRHAISSSSKIIGPTVFSIVLAPWFPVPPRHLPTDGSCGAARNTRKYFPAK